MYVYASKLEAPTTTMYMVWLRVWCLYHMHTRSKCPRTNFVKSCISFQAWMYTNMTPLARITSGTCLCSKESARLDLYPLSPRLPSCRRDGRESQGERLWVLCTEPDLHPSEWRNHWARADSPRQEVHLWQMMQVNRLNRRAMVQAVMTSHRGGSGLIPEQFVVDKVAWDRCF